MSGDLRQIAGRRVWVCAANGTIIATERDATDLIGDLFGQEVEWVAIPLERLGPEFLRLSSGVAGAILQKLVTYRFRVAIVGDFSAAIARSGPLADFVRESNRGRSVWFVPDLESLAGRLAA